MHHVNNSLLSELRAEPAGRSPLESREVSGAHYTRVHPTVEAPSPRLICVSEAVADQLGLSTADCESDEFLDIFSGQLAPEVECWATVYGASFAGRYGGQRGDGRAISIGQIAGQYEVQLKGAGVTPYSRRFDGRAVLRSCVREYLASEAMAALRVPTTRALCVVSTGERIRRAWYDDDGNERPMLEPGAVGARTAPSFLRFGQMELFHQRGEDELLRELATHALHREYAHLLLQHPGEPLSSSFVRMFAEVCERHAVLVAEWLRVGYCQGNMNSDNSALGGITLDYGPFGFMERYSPTYCPWVGGGLPYAFERQPQAAAVNLVGLSEAFASLAESVGRSEGLSAQERSEAVERIRSAVSDGFVTAFTTRHGANCREKLGLREWDMEARELWDELLGLMASSSGTGGVDFTLLFRALGEADVPPRRPADDSDDGAAPPRDPEAALRPLRRAALQSVDDWPTAHREGWLDWVARYWARVEREGQPDAERREQMAHANPKYILRNWMALEAYEAAERGDNTVLLEVSELLRRPYEAQGAEADERFAQPTPTWARNRPGLAYMS
jgi:uncharacterized protein YdiU (UPF0061 family)